MRGFPDGSVVKNPPGNAGDLGLISNLVGEIPWRMKWQPTRAFFPETIPWTEEPGRTQSIGCKESDMIECTHRR